jgi:hypothetical protein
MNIYFTGSIVGREQYKDEYLAIINYLKKKGHKVQSEHIFDKKEEEIKDESKQEILDFQERVESWIKEADFMIADTSFPSVSVGYEIAFAIRVGKPVLIFYGKGGPPSLLSYTKGERLISEKFSKDTYKKILDLFITYVSSKSDLRFTFFITPEIATFLDEIVQEEKVPKSVFIRKLLEREIKNHNIH